MAYRIAFELEGAPVLQSAGSGGAHWSSRRKIRKRWRDVVAWKCRELGRPRRPLPRARVTLTRYSPRACDFDNLVASFKPVLDGLVDGGVLAGDAPEHLEGGQARYRREPRGRVGIRVEVEATA